MRIDYCNNVAATARDTEFLTVRREHLLIGRGDVQPVVMSIRLTVPLEATPRAFTRT